MVSHSSCPNFLTASSHSSCVIPQGGGISSEDVTGLSVEGSKSLGIFFFTPGPSSTVQRHECSDYAGLAPETLPSSRQNIMNNWTDPFASPLLRRLCVIPQGGGIYCADVTGLSVEGSKSLGIFFFTPGPSSTVQRHECSDYAGLTPETLPSSRQNIMNNWTDPFAPPVCGGGRDRVAAARLKGGPSAGGSRGKERQRRVGC